MLQNSFLSFIHRVMFGALSLFPYMCMVGPPVGLESLYHLHRLGGRRAGGHGGHQRQMKRCGFSS